MSWNAALTGLRDILAELYPDEQDLCRLADQAGISWVQIELNGSPVTNWHRLLKYARSHRRLKVLAEIVRCEYPENKALAEAVEACLPGIDTSPKKKKPASRPVWRLFGVGVALLLLASSLALLFAIGFVRLPAARANQPALTTAAPATSAALRPSATPTCTPTASLLSATSVIVATVPPGLTPTLPPWPSPTANPSPAALSTSPPTQPSGYAPTALPTLITLSDVPMRLVHGGEFKMGSDLGYKDERPVHVIYLDSFYIDRYEVTNAQYARCVAAGACAPPRPFRSETRTSYYNDATFDDYPVINVTWEMSNTYCRWRGARLPTEAEWEKAARGGQEGARYPWGNESPDCTLANHAGRPEMCLGDTSPVGSYSPNGYGLYDMAGSVWEWVWDWYVEAFYSASPFANPTGPGASLYRVVRGGSWNSAGPYLRVADREKYQPNYTRNDIGFRCALTP